MTFYTAIWYILILFGKVDRDTEMRYHQKYIIPAFTLAEVIITIGIIGIVAAITIPGLITKCQSIRDSAILKEDYSILQQMMLRANDEGAAADLPYTDNNNQLREWFNTYCLPFIKVASVCPNGGKGCWTKNTKSPAGSNIFGGGDYHCGNGDVSFVLPNGSYVCLDDFKDFRMGVQGQNNETMIYLAIDINGDRRPNISGKDVFFVVFRDGEFLPAGYDAGENEVNKNCSKNGTGKFCMTKVRSFGYKLPVIK